MIISCEQQTVAEAIAAAMQTMYPSYQFVAYKPPGHRRWFIKAHCRATKALLLTKVTV